MALWAALGKLPTHPSGVPSLGGHTAQLLAPHWNRPEVSSQANLPVLGVRSCNQCVSQADSPQCQDLAKKPDRHSRRLALRALRHLLRSMKHIKVTNLHSQALCLPRPSDDRPFGGYGINRLRRDDLLC
jgi:hypothetical protein